MEHISNTSDYVAAAPPHITAHIFMTALENLIVRHTVIS